MYNYKKILAIFATLLIFLSFSSMAFLHAEASAVDKPVITNAYFDYINGKCYLMVSWNKVSNATNYKVFYYNTKNKSVSLGSTNTTSLVTSDLTSGTYTVYVVAETKKACYNSNTVKTKPYVKATSITLSTPRSNIICGNSKIINFTFKPANATKNISPVKEITWKSSNTDIASVDKNGKVTASKTKTGKVTITANHNATGVKSTITLYIHKYDIAAAVKYSDDHVYDGVGKCATFVSKCVIAGGFGWEIFKSNVEELKDTLLATNNGWRLIKNPAKSDIKIGDAIFYEKNGSWKHTTFCVGIKNGVPIVNSHNEERFHVKYAYYGGGTTIYVLQIAD